ncbi:MAG: thiol-activated cytolysin family protein [Ignavibacteriales bacterium]|nr:thiol-activated cytolysin family protein [Ignavibacteriales bacterium]
MINQIKTILSFIVLISFFISSCTEDGPNAPSAEQNADNIRDYISKLSYNSEEMLNYQQTNGLPSERDVLSDSSETIENGDYVTICKNTEYNLRKNFEEVAILRPSNGVIWPGALVKGNQSLMDGVPEEIGIDRAPITISVDLPGIGENGIRTIQNPKLSNVDAAIDSALQWWNDNAYEEGYVNAANSSYSVSSSYSSKQLALDVDLNVEWAAGSVSSQFNFTSDEEKKVVMMVYKQAFYDVRFDRPTSPESVFSDQVSLKDVEEVINNSVAPAYIKTVTYGRIIMFRMETINSYKSVDVEGALNYAGGASVDANVKATYDEILETSSINLVILGGNAEVATEAISSPGDDANTILERVQGVIKGKNAVYSKDNPGVPIGYSVFYLKDNSLAKLGYTTEYKAKECISTKATNTVTLFLDQFYVSQDCDGWPLGDGEFLFYIEILNQNNNKIVDTYDSGWSAYGDGDNKKINITRVFNMKIGEDKRFTIKLTCYEKDYDLFGNPHYDDRMNGRSNSITYINYDDGSWSDGLSYDYVYTKYLYLGESNCNVNLKYSIKVE